jgi:hypothetical protein
MDSVKGGYKSSHPGLFTVKFVPGNFVSSLIAQSVSWISYSSAEDLPFEKAFQAGQTLVSLEGKKVPDRTYYTVQCGPNPEDHLDLTSDLVYGMSQITVISNQERLETLFTVNHSCEPNVAFDLSSPNASKWHVRALKSIQPGDTRKYSPIYHLSD